MSKILYLEYKTDNKYKNTTSKYHFFFIEEEFEDTKGITRIRKSKC
jgi:hypothetical protein